MKGRRKYESVKKTKLKKIGKGEWTNKAKKQKVKKTKKKRIT